MADRGDQSSCMGLQGLTTIDCQSELSHRLSVAEFLVNRYETARLEPTGMRGKVAVGELGCVAELNELLSLINRQ